MPPAPSTVASGPRRKRRRSESASGAVASCATSPPTTAPTSAATGCQSRRALSDSACGPSREPIQAPTANPASDSAWATSPRRKPIIADSTTQTITIRSTPVTLRSIALDRRVRHCERGYLTIESTPRLQRPTMVAAFRGWNDAGSAASLAAGYLRVVTDAERFAVIDPDPFVDYQQTRPTRVARGRPRAQRRPGPRPSSWQPRRATS